MSQELINKWLEEGKLITKYYEDQIKDGKEAELDFRFLDGLFHKVEFEHKSMSILDFYCGKGHVFDYAQHKGFKIGKYVGLDIVQEHIDAITEKLPNREIHHMHFVDPAFNPDQHFQIVACFGPLLHKVSEQEKYVEFVIQKALTFTKKYALFNVITEIDPKSPRYALKDQIGQVTNIDEKTIVDVLKKISKQRKIDVKLHKGKIVDDATEAFIQIEVLDFEEKFVESHLHYFQDYAIKGQEPDHIIFDMDEGDHKAVWFAKPQGFDEVAVLDEKKPKGGYYIKNNTPCYPVIIEMYKEKSFLEGNENAINLRIGKPEDVTMQTTVSLKKAGKWLPYDNPNKK